MNLMMMTMMKTMDHEVFNIIQDEIDEYGALTEETIHVWLKT